MITIKGALPKDHQYIFCGNHGNFRDVFIAKIVDPKVRVMAAHQVLFWCPYLYLLGCYRNKPGGINKSIELINQGYNLAIFPEGWTDLTSRINKFHTGSSVISKLTNTPIVPIRIRYNRYYGEWIKKFPDVIQYLIDFIVNPMPKVEVIIGDPQPAGIEAEKLREIIINM